MKHLEEEDLILYYYREASDLASMEAHLRSCAACRAELERLERLLDTVSQAAVPDRGADYGRSVWRRIRPHMAPARRFDSRRWALAAAVLLMVSGAFLAGRFWPGTDVERVAVNEPVGERLLLLSLRDHLDRSQILLVDVANGGFSEDADGREVASELVASF
jgi:anti-sigma factor RsiW